METAQQTQPKLLLVDDEENILRSLRRVFRQERWNIAAATSAEQALESLGQFAPDVVVSDYRMPGMNGIEFLSRVKEQSPRTQRIMLTGQADQQAVEEAINRSEVFRFITKPWNDAQLVLTVKSAIEQRQLQEDNGRLWRLTEEQNAELRRVNAELEERVALRTQQLSRAKREWETTFDAIELPVTLVGREYTLRRANLACAKAAGRPIVEVGKGPKCHQYLFGASSPCAGCPVSTGARSEAFEVRHQDSIYSVSQYPSEDAVVCVYRDVSREREMTARMLEAEKLVAVGNLAGGVAHEINNPLGGILAFAQLMRRDQGRSPTDLESLQLIEESALRCKRIVESLLKFSRRSREPSRRTLDLSKCVEDAAVLFRGQIKSFPRAKLELRLASDLPDVHADSSQLVQVVLNLLQNALHALPAGEGELTVTTGKEDGYCYFEVADTGTGIAPEHLKRIFEPHFTTKPPGEGTGLGLAIAYRIVQDHGGHFEVHSTPGAGSTFRVRLPYDVESLRNP